MQRNRLVMKARRDRAEAITDRMFSACERYRPKEDQKAETVEEFLKRGGKIDVIHERR